MKDYFYLNPSKMMELSRQLTGSEIKMVYGIMYCLSDNGERWFVNNRENRAKLAEIEFDKSPEWISVVLSKLVKKGVLKREAQGVFSLVDGLFINPNEKIISLP